MNAAGMNRRLDRLAKFLPPLPTCKKCMYPRPDSQCYIMTDHDHPMEQCPGCGRNLDEDGVPLHQPYTRLILMRDDPPSQSKTE